MVLVHNSNLTTIKDFSANAFCKNATQKKKSTKSIHPDTLIGTCYYRTANKYVDQIIGEIKALYEIWEETPEKTPRKQNAFILQKLQESKIPKQEVSRFMNTMNDKYGFVEAVAREIDGTKEKINFICTYIDKRKEMVMQEDFYVKQQISGSLQRKQTIEAGLEGGVTYINGIKYSEREMAILRTEFLREKGRNPKNNTELKEYLEFDSYPLNLLEYIRIEGHPPLNREILNKFIEARKK